MMGAMRLLMFVSGLMAVVSGFGRQDSWDFGYANRAASPKDRFKANVDPSQLKTPKFILDQLGQRTSGGNEEDNFYEDEVAPPRWPPRRPPGRWPEDGLESEPLPEPEPLPLPWNPSKLPPFFYPVLIPVPVPVPAHDSFPPIPLKGRLSGREGGNRRRHRGFRAW